MTPEHSIIFSSREAMAFLEARHRTEETMALREMLQRSMEQMVKKWGEPIKRVNPLPFPRKANVQA